MCLIILPTIHISAHKYESLPKVQHHLGEIFQTPLAQREKGDDTGTFNQDEGDQLSIFPRVELRNLQERNNYPNSDVIIEPSEGFRGNRLIRQPSESEPRFISNMPGDRGQYGSPTDYSGSGYRGESPPIVGGEHSGGRGDPVRSHSFNNPSVRQQQPTAYSTREEDFAHPSQSVMGEQRHRGRRYIGGDAPTMGEAYRATRPGERNGFGNMAEPRDGEEGRSTGYRDHNYRRRGDRDDIGSRSSQDQVYMSEPGRPQDPSIAQGSPEHGLGPNAHRNEGQNFPPRMGQTPSSSGVLGDRPRAAPTVQSSTPATEVDENSKNWVRPNYPVEPMPRNVVVALNLIRTNYVGIITIGVPRPGYPEQRLRVNFDSGSTLLWVVTKDACDKGFCNRQNWYDRRFSESYNPIGTPLKTKYVATARISGTEAEEYFFLGDGKNKLVIKNQHFGEVNEFKDVLGDYDVIFGCTIEQPSTLRADGEPDPPLYQMTKQFGTAPVFSVYFNKYVPSKSRLIFGVEDDVTDMVAGPFHTHRVVKVKSKKYGWIYRGWNLEVEGWIVEGINSRPFIFPAPDEIVVHVDTGSTHIGGPRSLIRPLNEAIFSFARFPFSEDFSFDCRVDVLEVWKTFPNVSLMIDGVKYTFEPHDYIGQVGGQCTSFFMELNMHNAIILGHPFLNKYYTRFDHGNMQVQIALLKQDPHPVKYLRNALRLLGRQ